MKLLTKTSLIFITVSLFVFFISGVILYNVIKTMTDENINKELYSGFHKLGRQLRHQPDSLLENKMILSDAVELTRIHNPDAMKVGKYALQDTLLFNELLGIYQPYRYFSGYISHENAIYELRIYKSLIESNALVEKITLAITFMTLLLIVGVFFLIRLLGENIWKPFFVALDQLTNFNVANTKEIELQDTDIYEFIILNQTLKRLINRIQQDFVNLKEFTENITHEIQTPLAVIKTKTELLLQHPNLTNDQAQLLSSVNLSLSRLTKLNHGLVLLTKIENNQFHETHHVNIHTLINSQIEMLDDFIQAKAIRMERIIDDSPVLHMNQVLADILIQNLLKNAVFHNAENGKLFVHLQQQLLEISNTGSADSMPQDTQDLFNRFTRGHMFSKSMGIGLSLVKKICDYYAINISYRIQDKVHRISLKFPGDLVMPSNHSK